MEPWGGRKGRLAARTKVGYRLEKSIRTIDGRLCFVECELLRLGCCWIGSVCRLEAGSGCLNVVNQSSPGETPSSLRSQQESGWRLEALSFLSSKRIYPAEATRRAR